MCLPALTWVTGFLYNVWLIWRRIFIWLIWFSSKLIIIVHTNFIFKFNVGSRRDDAAEKLNPGFSKAIRDFSYIYGYQLHASLFAINSGCLFLFEDNV